MTRKWFPDADEFGCLTARMANDRRGRDDILWSENLRRPRDADAMAFELCWVIVNSGMRYTVARKIWPPMREALIQLGQIPQALYGHEGKRRSMNALWSARGDLFAQLPTIADADLPDWCEKIDWIGPITKHHAAKNLGADVAKPDRWIERLVARSARAGGPGDARALCAALAGEAAIRVATADLILWWGCQSGEIVIPDDPKARPFLRDRPGELPR